MKNKITKSTKGKYGGKCPKCKSLLFEGELLCKHCGKVFDKPRVSCDCTGNPKE